MRRLVLANEFLPFVSRRILRLEERTAGLHSDSRLPAATDRKRSCVAQSSRGGLLHHLRQVDPTPGSALGSAYPPAPRAEHGGSPQESTSESCVLPMSPGAPAWRVQFAVANRDRNHPPERREVAVVRAVPGARAAHLRDSLWDRGGPFRSSHCTRRTLPIPARHSSPVHPPSRAPVVAAAHVSSRVIRAEAMDRAVILRHRVGTGPDPGKALPACRNVAERRGRGGGRRCRPTSAR